MVWEGLGAVATGRVVSSDFYLTFSKSVTYGSSPQNSDFLKTAIYGTPIIQMLGATKPSDSAPGTIRGDFALDVGR
jgi:hypothetical protein